MVFGLFNSPTPYKGQKYNDLKKDAIASGHPFIDREFPPDDKSLFYSGGAKMSGIEWKRPKDICGDDSPKLFVEGLSSHDLIQGALGNCWFVAASSCLAASKEIWQKVIPNPKDQEWDDAHPEKYGGIFHFQFWRYGEWFDVVIDDFLPTRSGNLVFVHSQTKNEFWSALLEKAYAKLFGSYEALDGGELAEALEDFTGGVTETCDLVEGQYSEDEPKREGMYKMLKIAIDNKALMAAAIPAKSSEEMEQAIDVGLVKGHAYGITAVRRVALEGTGIFNIFNKDKLAMIRLRNPWGGCEWTGAFSDGSDEWKKIDKASREKIGLTFDDDGEFWMTFEDFCKYFTTMAVCRVVNTSLISLQKTWSETELHSEWRAPHLSGGCINHRDTFLNNPQFVFVISENKETALISLTQKSSRGDKQADKVTIGFTVMKVEENRIYRVHKIQEIIKSSSFKNSRSIFLRHDFDKGRYVLVATTFDVGVNGPFMLRVYTGANNHGKELQLDKPKQSSLASMCSCFVCCRYPTSVTRITVLNAVGLEKQDRSGGADPYCIISCEGEKVRTPVCQDTTNPVWNITAIFYRRQPSSKPIKVQIWNSNVIRDEFMGEHRFQVSDECENKGIEAGLLDRKKNNPGVRPGKVTVQVTTCRNLQAL